MKRTIHYDVNNKRVEREINYIPFRYIVAVLITLFEVLAVIGIVVACCYYVPYFYLAAWATEIFCVIRIIASDDNPDYKVPWLLFVLIVPIAGFMLYFMFYSRTLQKKFIKRLNEMKSHTYQQADGALLHTLREEDPTAAAQAQMLMGIADTHLFTNTKQEYFPLGEDMHRRLLEDLKKAEKFIYMEYFIIGFAVSCCMMLFLNTLADSMGLAFTSGNITSAAKITFINVLLLTFIFAVIDYIRRKINVDRPVKVITDTTEKIMQGDFTARVPDMRGAGMEGFNQIGTAVNAMAQELSGIETLRTDFVANVSHEMKTPLAVMQNYGTLLQADDLPEEKRIEYAKGVTDGARRMAEMMTNILKLNRLENQQIYPQATEFDLGEQICQCLLQYENIWEKANIEIETDIAEDVKIKADAELLSHVWNNLFSNAFKFTPEGGTVAVTMYATEQYAVVKVADTGCGMSADVGAHIFEKFYQGDTSHATRGNGLGLALVKRVIDIMQGEIGVESVVGKGSAFTVKIRRT